MIERQAGERRADIGPALDHRHFIFVEIEIYRLREER